MTFDPNRNLGCHDDDDCIGGYRQVTEAYVERHAPNRPVPFPKVALAEPPDDLDGFARTEWMQQLAVNRHHVMTEASQRVATANSVYPCHVCNPDQFLRWSEGDWPYPKRKTTTDAKRSAYDGPPPLSDADAPVDDEAFDPTRYMPDDDGVDPLTAHEHARADVR